MRPPLVILVFMAANLGLLGLAIVYWAVPLSRSYNAWTDDFRERRLGLEPRTPEHNKRTLNKALLLTRLLGAIFVLEPIVMVILVWNPF